MYIYDVTGTKLRKTLNETTTGYIGNFVYVNDVLQFFTTPEGYVDPNGSNWNYVYQYKDHLGNIRLSYTDVNQNNANPVSLQIKEENNYYPFGLKQKGYNTTINGRHHKYMFGAKEQQDELGLNWYDITARNYDPALGRWMNLDPLAEKSRRWSPYNYAYDNPIFFIDSDGQEPSPAALKKAAKILGVSVSIIRAIYKVESHGNAFRSNGDPKVLFERHHFSQLTGGKYDKMYPDISNPVSGGYGKNRDQLIKLRRAAKLDKMAAYKSTSFGIYQIMGSNYKSAGYKSLFAFASTMMSKDEDKQLEAFVNFALNNKSLLKALRTLDFEKIARFYNGRKYKKNKYDTQLMEAYNSYEEEQAKKDAWKAFWKKIEDQFNKMMKIWNSAEFQKALDNKPN